MSANLFALNLFHPTASISLNQRPNTWLTLHHSTNWTALQVNENIQIPFQPLKSQNWKAATHLKTRGLRNLIWLEVSQNCEPNPIGQYPYAPPTHYSKAPHALGGLRGESELSYSNILLKAGEVEVAKHCGTEKRPLLRLCIFTSHHAQLVRHDRPCTNIAINNFSIIIAHLSDHRKLKHVGQSSSCTKSSRNPTQVKKVSSSHQTTRGWLTFWFKC